MHFEPNIDDSEDFNLGSTENSKRFGPPLSEDALDQAISDRIPKKTQKTTQWAVSVFHAWCDARGVKNATENMAIEVLVDLLPRFIMEARRGRLVKEMCEHAGFSSRYTNHSGKVTCATELFAHNVDDWKMSSVSFHWYQIVSFWGSVQSSFLKVWTLYVLKSQV